MQRTAFLVPVAAIIMLAYISVFVLFVILIVLVIKALLKYLRAGEVRQETRQLRASLGEVLKAHRREKQMTQEFVSESIGVSRQAVSKWENGTADPSTANLFALAKLYGVSAEDLLNEIGNPSSINHS